VIRRHSHFQLRKGVWCPDGENFTATGVMGTGSHNHSTNGNFWKMRTYHAGRVFRALVIGGALIASLYAVAMPFAA
jgi:hypothetical protein